MLNLVVSVTLNTFNDVKLTTGKSALLTDSQHEWLQIQKMMADSKPRRKYPEPPGPLRRRIFRIVMSTAFEYFIICVILANVLCMSVLPLADMKRGICLKRLPV